MEEIEDVIKNTKEQRKRRKRKIEHMQQVFHEIMLKTKGQGFYNFTEKTLGWLNKQKINNGILNIIKIAQRSTFNMKNLFIFRNII